MKGREPLLLFSPVFISCASFQRESDDIGSIRDGVEDLLESYSAAIREGRWGDVGALYMDDPRFSWVEDGRVAYRSADDVRAALTGLEASFRQGQTQFAILSVDSITPATAHLTARVQQTFLRPDEEEFSFTVMMTALVVRTPSGWRFLAGHTSTLQQP